MRDFTTTSMAVLRGIIARADLVRDHRAVWRGRHAAAVTHAAWREIQRREWEAARYVLETGAVVEHCDYNGEVCEHASVTEMLVCDGRVRAEQAAQHAAEVWAEGGYDRWAEGGWDVTGAYSAELYHPHYV